MAHSARLAISTVLFSWLQYLMAITHLHSYDLSEGASDNAAGVVALFEAVNLLNIIGLRPKRNVRLIFRAAHELKQADGKPQCDDFH
jgi:Zn-dependent M28 family amino/carboxypeptidase